MQTKNQPKRGRPSVYSDEIVERICERLGRGESLRAICADVGMPNRATVSRWLARYEEFRGLYGFAREWQTDRLWDDVIIIADDNSVNIAHGRVRINALKSRIARLTPRKYGKPRDVYEY